MGMNNNPFAAVAKELKVALGSVDAIWSNASREVAESLARDIRTEMRELGAPQDLIDALGVYNDRRGDLYVGVPWDDPAMQQALADYEFGSVERAPSATFFRAGQNEEWREELEAKLARYMAVSL